MPRIESAWQEASLYVKAIGGAERVTLVNPENAIRK